MATAKSPCTCALAGVICLLLLANMELFQVEAFCSKYVELQGYSCEEYKMYTEDGYGLLMHRVGATGRKQSITITAKSHLPSTSFRQTTGIPLLRRPNLLPAKESISPTSEVEGSLNDLVACILTSSCQTSSVQASSASASSRPAQVPIVITGDSPSMSTSLPPTASPEDSRMLTSPAGPQARSLGPSLLPTSSRNVPITGDGKVQGPSQARRSRRGDPVLLLHPELLNGDSWFKPADSDNTALLPFMLVDEGFDVWIGHERATFWSHDHVAVTHNEPAYWNWTWDQLAQHDVPTMLRFLNSETNGKVHVVGVSQSATVAAAATTRADVAELMNTLTLVGPTVYRGSRNTLLMRAWTGFVDHITTDGMSLTPSSPLGPFNFSREFAMSSLSMAEPRSELWDTISVHCDRSRYLPGQVIYEGRSGADGQDFLEPLQNQLTRLSLVDNMPIYGPDCCLSPSLSVFDNGWDGTTSSSNVEHVEQAMLTNTWQKFDYGTPELNFDAYGVPAPPFYEPRDIPADLPVLIIHGGHDSYSPPAGIMEFLATMHNRPSRVFLPAYAHMDLFFSERRTQDVYDPICAFLKSNGSA